MRQVFSRWPSVAQTLHQPLAGDDGLPAWMQTPPSRRSATAGAADLAASGLTVGILVVLAFLAGSTGASLSGPLPILCGILALLAAAAVTAHLKALRRGRRSSEEAFEAIYERSGISIWREDWTAVADAVMALRRDGIVDLECHFANHPDELRALRAKVIITDVNAFTLEETGAASKDAYLGSLDRLLPDTDQTFVQWLVAFGRGDRFFRSEAHIMSADGRERDVLFTATLPQERAAFSDVIVSSLDVTAFKRAQAHLAAADTELARTSRIITVGALSASIAHEVNSPLAAIVANAQAALRWLRRPEPDTLEASLALDDVVASATRARDVVARTRSYLGNAPRIVAPIDLVQAARDANLLVEREIRAHGAAIHLATEEGIPPVPADLIQIQQIFVNLLVNAAQAMADGPGPKDIMIGIHRTAASVEVEVADTGPGIEPERRARIFEPFHSTKVGGMGMGLAICRNLIDAHGGDIWVDVAPTGGAAFHFMLPLAHD
ncbi:sensor histidine kinase [Methylobacterium sp. Leaf118]|uniref:sensor histidine kinase n=1 Tax=Methylobacterium sp. Leaf118 TaxID=2876562 RepID=UPI001E3FFA10|nr:ATP-binding protein [Methylobacterium sp. Leaf118]